MVIAPTFSHQFFTPALTIAYCVVGALVASQHPRNPIGWMFCATGLLSALNMLSAGYDLYDRLAGLNGTLPGAALARWLNLWLWLPNTLLPFTFVLLLFPTGRLLSVALASDCMGSRTGHGVLPLPSLSIPRRPES